MKRNVVLFSILTVAVLYIFYGAEKEDASQNQVGIESVSATPEESETIIYHARKLLSFPDTHSKQVDVPWASFRNEDTRLQHELLEEASKTFSAGSHKFTRRRKRRVANKKEQFAWKFNLNVTRYENDEISNKPIAYPTSIQEEPTKKSDDRYLGMAMSVSGNGPNQSIEELYQAWDSVGHFLRSLFGGNLEELKNKGHGVSVDVSPLPNGTIDLPSELLLEGSGEEDSQESRNRKGKFLLGIFGFGGNKENPPRDEGSGDVMEIQEFSRTDSIAETHLSKEIENGSNTLETTVDNGSISISTISTENLKQYVVSSSILEPVPFTTSDPEISVQMTSVSSIVEALSEANCTDCDIQSEFFSSTDGKISLEQNPTSNALVSSTITSGLPMSEEALKDFCNALFSRMRTSGRSLEESANFQGSGSFAIDETNVSDVTTDNTHDSKVLTDKPRSQNLGFLESIWNRIMGRTVPPIQEESLNESRGARLINFGNLFAGFGSGRSAELDDSSVIEFDNMDTDINKNIEDNEQFLSDCEEFLRSVQTETRPNIFDLIDPNPSESVNTELTTRSGGSSLFSEEVNVENITANENALNYESTTQNEIFTFISSIAETDVEDQVQSKWPNIQPTTQMEVTLYEENADITHLEETTKMEDKVFTEIEEKVQSDSLSVQNLVVENLNETEEWPITKTSDVTVIINASETEFTTNALNGTHASVDRSFNLFGFGSGTEDVSDEGSSDVSNIKERFFGGLINFGSGDREIKEIPVSTERSLIQTIENSKRRSFGLFNFGSGEREIKEIDFSTEKSSENTTTGSNERSFSLNIDFGSGARELEVLNKSEFDNEDSRTSTVGNNGRIFEWNLSFGSGERELQEIVELTTVTEEAESTFVFASTEDSKITPSRPLTTISFSEETLEQSTNILLDDPDKSEEIFTETKDERSLGLNIFGSGDVREISDVLTNDDDVNCVDCLSDNITVTECGSCGRILNESTILVTSTIKNTALDQILLENPICADCKVTNNPNLQDDISVSDSLLDKTPSSTDILSREEDKTDGSDLEDSTPMVQQPISAKSEIPLIEGITEITLETTTAENKSRFLGTIFLTGSGDGGLFVDNQGPINLVQENEFTSPVFQQTIQFRRGARKHDHLEFQEPTEESSLESKESVPFRITTQSNFVQSPTPVDISSLSTFTTELDKTEISSVSLGTNNDIVTSVPASTVQPGFSEITVKSTSIQTTTKDVTEQMSTTNGVVISTSISIKPRSKVTEPPQTFCTSASQCNRDLNERCISSMCNCGRSYVRSPETGKCESPVVLTTSLKLPGEVFHQDLKDRNSKRFRKMANDSIETMWILLGDDPALFRLVAGVDVSGFEEGSLVVHWAITLAAPQNESIAELIDQLDAELKEAFEDEALLRKAPLNVHNAVLMAVTNDIDPCEKTELNYCSKNADCIRDPLRGFKCRCRDDFLDQSTDMNHPGEQCIATCTPYYCGDHGECNLKQNGDLHCSCNSWYFGAKCEISGIVVIAGFASFNVLLIIIVLFMVCYCRKRRYRQSRFYGQNQVRFQPETELGRFTASPRLADTMALGDVGPTKTSKYMAISTPIHNTPVIRLTSPSILGCSDLDYDSTFDRTPSVEEVRVEVHQSKETSKV